MLGTHVERPCGSSAGPFSWGSLTRLTPVYEPTILTSVEIATLATLVDAHAKVLFCNRLSCACGRRSGAASWAKLRWRGDLEIGRSTRGRIHSCSPISLQARRSGAAGESAPGWPAPAETAE